MSKSNKNIPVNMNLHQSQIGTPSLFGRLVNHQDRIVHCVIVVRMPSQACMLVSV
jgi:hypothetical protein